MKNNYRFFPWCFPCNFFMFLTFFLSIKFIFIFLFNSFFEPDFIFDLTPFHMLEGFGKLQLLFLSLTFVLFDAYLHYNNTKKNILISFFPTFFLITGIGLAISYEEISMVNIFHYIIFLCLLFVVLIDHRYLLEYHEEIIPQPDVISEQPTNLRTKLPAAKIFVSDLKAPQKNILSSFLDATELEIQRIDFLLKDLESKKDKSNKLEYEINQRRKNLVSKESDFAARLSELAGLSDVKLSKNTENNIEENQNDKSLFDGTDDGVVMLYRGRMKEMNESFAKLLGFNIDEIINKNIIDFIVPEDLTKIEKYYFKRLKGKPVSYFEAAFLSKNHEKIPVEITTEDKIYNGKLMKIIIVKKKKTSDKN